MREKRNKLKRPNRKIRNRRFGRFTLKQRRIVAQWYNDMKTADVPESDCWPH